jgi:hypothetical protein
LLFADAYHLAGLDRIHDRPARWYVRQEIHETVGPGADDEDCNSPASQILFVLKALVHRQKYCKAGSFGVGLTAAI